jgi:hypothetical protein
MAFHGPVMRCCGSNAKMPLRPMMRMALLANPPRRRLLLSGLTVIACLQAQAQAQVTQRNLVVELRSMAQPQAGVVSTQHSEADSLQPQMVRVKNGEKATLRMGNTVPVQWVQAAVAQASARTTSAASSSSSSNSAGGGVVNAITVLQAGQSLTVKPRWPGGKQAVTVEIELQHSGVDTSTGAVLPSQPQQQLSTTLVVPLDQWVTIAASAQGVEQRGVYSSKAALQVPQQIQLRISAP